MKRDILLLCIINMLGLLIFTNVDHILWLTEYSKTGINWTEELFPLLINNIIWLSLIPLFLIWKTQMIISKKYIHTFDSNCISSSSYNRICTNY